MTKNVQDSSVEPGGVEGFTVELEMAPRVSRRPSVPAIMPRVAKLFNLFYINIALQTLIVWIFLLIFRYPRSNLLYYLSNSILLSKILIR